LAEGAARGERIGLAVLLGLSLYLVKVLSNPFGFTFADELAHAPNANAILRTHELFASNAILPVTAYYPGLESVTAALAAMTGLSSFGAGLIVIGTARLLMMLGLFLLFERLSGSARAAGVGAAVYVANPNFLFFSAQFSYESLALPLLVMTLFAVTEWRAGTDRLQWSVVAMLSTVAVVATHHMSSYALTAALIAIWIAHRVLRGRVSEAPVRFAVFAAVATAAWLTFVASTTVGYLSPVLTKAFTSTIHTFTGEAAPRRLFTSGGAYHVSVLERGTGIAAVLLLTAAFPFGARIFWRRYRFDPIALVLATAGVGVFVTYALRFAPAAWETANRASEFVFIGLAFVIGLLAAERWPQRSARGAVRCLAAVCLAVVFTGGVIAGWTPSLRLSQPYRIKVAGATLDPEGRLLAQWTRKYLPPQRRFAASDADARMINTYGGGFAYTGRSPDVLDVLQTSTLPQWELDLLHRYGISYVVVDRRLKSFDIEAGYFFGLRRGSTAVKALLSPEVTRKFDAAGAERLFDTGDIVVYDVRSSG
jgi:hypothetical protein